MIYLFIKSESDWVNECLPDYQTIQLSDWTNLIASTSTNRLLRSEEEGVQLLDTDESHSYHPVSTCIPYYAG